MGKLRPTRKGWKGNAHALLDHIKELAPSEDLARNIEIAMNHIGNVKASSF